MKIFIHHSCSNASNADIHTSQGSTFEEWWSQVNAQALRMAAITSAVTSKAAIILLMDHSCVIKHIFL